mgnify:CR=1 FL=1
MPTRTYNTFYPWIKQDDKIWNPGFIDASNLTGLSTWEWITLWPKSNKLFTTNGAMRGIHIEPQTRTTKNNENFAFWDDWEIYRFDWADLTPVYTVSTWFDVWGFTIIQWDPYFLHRETVSWNTLNLWKSQNYDFTSWVDESYDLQFISHTEVVPIQEYWDEYIFGWSGKVVSLPSTNDPVTWKTNYSIFSWVCNWISTIWNQLYLYNSRWKVHQWNWSSNALSGTNTVNFPPRKVHQTASETFVTSRDWSIYKGNGWQFGTWPLMKFKKSKRLEDNSTYQDKFNFSWTEEVRWQYIASAWDAIYVGCNDWVPWIYIHDNIVLWTRKGFHKAITTNHEGTAIDEIYAIAYDHTQDRVFYSYKAGTTYGIDYVSTVDRESTTTGYGVTEVFTGWTSFKKELNVARISVSNVDATNTAKLYYRINDQEWILLREINWTTEDIYNRQNISKESDWNPFKQFIDIQFKIELTSANNDNTPPTLNELMIDYTIIEA